MSGKGKFLAQTTLYLGKNAVLPGHSGSRDHRYLLNKGRGTSYDLTASSQKAKESASNISTPTPTTPTLPSYRRIHLATKDGDAFEQIHDGSGIKDRSSKDAEPVAIMSRSERAFPPAHTPTTKLPPPSTPTPSSPRRIHLASKYADIFDSPPPRTLFIRACNPNGLWKNSTAETFKLQYPAAHAIYQDHCSRSFPQDLVGTALLIGPRPDDARQHYIGCLFTQKGDASRREEPREVLRALGTAMADLLRQVSRDGGVGEMRMCSFTGGPFKLEGLQVWRTIRELELGEGDFVGWRGVQITTYRANAFDKKSTPKAERRRLWALARERRKAEEKRKEKREQMANRLALAEEMRKAEDNRREKQKRKAEEKPKEKQLKQMANRLTSLPPKGGKVKGGRKTKGETKANG